MSLPDSLSSNAMLRPLAPSIKRNTGGFASALFSSPSQQVAYEHQRPVTTMGSRRDMVGTVEGVDRSKYCLSSKDPHLILLVTENILHASYLQAQCAGDLGSAHHLATHHEVAAAGGDALAAQLRESIHGGLAHAHVVGRDVGSQALQSSSAGGRSRAVGLQNHECIPVGGKKRTGCANLQSACEAITQQQWLTWGIGTSDSDCRALGEHKLSHPNPRTQRALLTGAAGAAGAERTGEEGRVLGRLGVRAW
eukprot:scaffold110529_cov16-Tisochrysis_lutea.AAC.1